MLNRSSNRKDRPFTHSYDFSKKRMSDFIDSCFNPTNLQLFVHKKIASKGYEILSEDYTKERFLSNKAIISKICLQNFFLNPAECYYLDKMEKYLDMECNDSAIINGKITNDKLLKTVLFESDFPNCILPKE